MVNGKMEFKEHICPDGEKFCQKENTCINNTLCSCNNELQKNKIVFLPHPFFYYYYHKNIDYGTTCKNTLMEFNRQEIAISNPFIKRQYILCSKSNDETINWEEKTCCLDYVFCSANEKCMKKDECSCLGQGKNIKYIAKNPVTFSSEDLFALNDGYLL